MEQPEFSFRQFIYLSGGLFLILTFLLILKFVFPNTTTDILPIESFNNPVSLNLDLLRKPIIVGLPSLSIDFSVVPETTTTGAFIDLIAEVKGVSQGPFAYHFDCQSDGIFELETEPSFQKKYTAQKLCFFNQEGNFTAKVVVDGFFDYFQDGREVKEKKTEQAIAKVLIQTTNLAPIFSNCDVDNIEGTTQVSFKFNFTSQANDQNGDEIKYEWDFGDGNTAVGQNIEYNYKKMGFFAPKVKATDSKGASSYCVAKSLTILSGLSFFETVQKSQIKTIGRQNPFSPVKPGEVELAATTTQATTTNP